MTGHARNDAIPPLQGPVGNTTTNDYDKATLLKEYFAAQSTCHIPKDQKPPSSPTDKPPVHTLDNITRDDHEVLAIVNSLDPHKSTGPDNLPIIFFN